MSKKIVLTFSLENQYELAFNEEGWAELVENDLEMFNVVEEGQDPEDLDIIYNSLDRACIEDILMEYATEGTRTNTLAGRLNDLEEVEA
jgi:hypothetical protein